MPSCTWRQVEIAACSDGTVRLLVNGRQVERGAWDLALEDARAIANSAATLTTVKEAGSMTAADLATSEGIALTAASERLRTAHRLGLLCREREGNRFRYAVATRAAHRDEAPDA